MESAAGHEVSGGDSLAATAGRGWAGPSGHTRSGLNVLHLLRAG